MPKATRKEVMDRKSYLNKGFTTPQGFNPNDKKSQQIELPSGNGIGTARALAKIYHEFAMGAPNLQFDKNTFYELTAAANLPPAGPMDEVMAVPTYYRVGMLKPGPKITFGSSQKAFGTPGAGGSFAFADPDKQLGYAYVMTKMGLYLKDDPRETALQNAVYECIEIMEKNMALRQQSTRIMEADRKSQ
jgi:CubicO group peptidase (beta-lactamase class C family)